MYCMFFFTIPILYHGWEFAHQFFEQFALFVSERVIRLWKKRANCSHYSFVMSDLSKLLKVAILSWATWANCSQFFFVMSDGSKSLKLLFKKECMREERRERFALGHKKGENCQKHMKHMNFSSESVFFASDSLESRVICSHCSFVKSNLS